MTVRRILVHADTGAETEARITLGASLARSHGARLEGLFAECDPAVQSLSSPPPGRVLSAGADRVAELFRSRTASLSPPSAWHQVEFAHHSQVLMTVMGAARLSDLTILGQDARQIAGGEIPEDLTEQTMLHAGRPVLAIPNGWTRSEIGREAVIAWNDGREAARAVFDALPFLTGAKRVTVVHIRTDRDTIEKPAGAGVSGGLLAVVDWLALHGIRAQSETVAVEGIGAMDMLLAQCGDLGADLLVMGGHGQYGLPFLHRGGATRYILRHLTLPVLMSH